MENLFGYRPEPGHVIELRKRSLGCEKGVDCFNSDNVCWRWLFVSLIVLWFIFLHFSRHYVDNFGDCAITSLRKGFARFLVLFTMRRPRAYLSAEVVNCICSSCDQMGNFQLWETISVNLDLFLLLSC